MSERFGVGALRCACTRQADGPRAETEMSPAQMWSAFSAVLGRQKPPQTDARSLGFAGESVSERIFSRQNCH